ncbi:hypothetical protein BC940DRAFT_279043 [Gongronella butleri]|nr:hypothetical protein BC940DRAFT_279043 [Gongronella butleri]
MTCLPSSAPRDSQPAIAPKAPHFNLEKVIHQYSTQPDLLNLILSCKVEEDRRLAEEAKLKRKEIEYYIQKQQGEPVDDKPRVSSSPSNMSSSPSPPTTLQPLPSWHRHHQTHANSLPPPSSLPQAPRRASNASNKEWRSNAIILPPLASPPTSHASSATSPKLDEFSLSPPSVSERLFPSPKRPLESLPKPIMHDLPSPREEKSMEQQQAPKRRRREMQAITTVIETREFPYNDDYLWRNNGNTIHKKTGNKSIYYKCANSQQGCPVNKTVTFKDNGEYLIKYRGSHLDDCSTIKRIHEV